MIMKTSINISKVLIMYSSSLKAASFVENLKYATIIEDTMKKYNKMLLADDETFERVFGSSV